MAGKHGFLKELQRRNVLRAGALYAGIVWALAQGIAQLGPLFDAPNWAMRAFVIACIIGFPFWLAFAWFYEFTPQGFRRESEVAPNESITLSTGRKLDFAIIGVLIVAVVLLASGYFVHRDAPAATVTASAFNPSADTLVVLPFANVSGDASQEYFSDGITEELTNALGQNAGLRVIAWDTAAHYRDSRKSATEIGKTLGVANVLTGKIQRQLDQVRVIVELVNTRTGFQVWANHYDDSLANVFQVQDEISTAIAGALKVKFASLGSAPTVNPQAHDLVLKSRALMDKARTAAPIEQARKLLEHAIAIDPGYAAAHAGLARAWNDLAVFSTLPIKDALPRVHAEATRALALDPRNVAALVQLGNADEADGNLGKAKVEYEQALALDPSNAGAHSGYANVLPLKPGLEQYQQAVQLDPDNAGAQNNLATAELDLGEYAQALVPFHAMLQLDPLSADSAFELAMTDALLHRDTDAVSAFDLAEPDTELARALVASGRLTYQSVHDPALRQQALATIQALRRRQDLDQYSMYDIIQLYLALGENKIALDLLPHNCAALPVGCNDLSVNPLFVSLRGDARFQALIKQYDTVSKPQ